MTEGIQGAGSNLIGRSTRSRRWIEAGRCSEHSCPGRGKSFNASMTAIRDTGTPKNKQFAAPLRLRSRQLTFVGRRLATEGWSPTGPDPSASLTY